MFWLTIQFTYIYKNHKQQYTIQYKTTLILFITYIRTELVYKTVLAKSVFLLTVVEKYF